MQRIAIIGVAFRFPGDLSDETAFWQALQNGSDLVSEVDPARWATDTLSHPRRNEPGRSITYSAGVLSRIDEFDAGFFGISPREAAWLDPQQRLLLELAWESFENAGVPPSTVAGSDCAVYVGISGLDYGTRALDDLATLSAHTMTGNTLSVAANRLSYVFDLHGPSLAIDTACSSSLVALHHACNCLRAGEASLALVGGVNILNHPYPFVGFTKASMLSAGGRCRTFDADGDGYVRAEGGAVLLLKPLEQAQADGDRIHGVILASGANADGSRKTGLTIPSREGQAELMRSVLARAGVSAADVDYLEAHGTGTAVGDPIETAAIGAVYGSARSPEQPLPIGSVKTNLGHLEPAAGMAGLVKALLVLKHRQIPPSINLQTPNPKIEFSAWHLQPVTANLPLPDTARPAIVGVNSFGFGGANAHVLLQEAPPVGFLPPPVCSHDALPIFLSARSELALRQLAAAYADCLDTQGNLYAVASAAAHQRERLEKRLALLADSCEGAIRLLRDFAAGGNPPDLVGEEALAQPGKLAFVYSGNGSQWVGMGQLLLAESASFRASFEEIETAVRQRAGFSLTEALLAAPESSQMADTAVAQPLLFAIQVALTRMLQEQGISPDAVTGHSVGEVAAAWAAGALTLDEAIHVICARSAAQARRRGAGRMAAVSLSEAAMRELLADPAWRDVEIAGINSPRNLTLSGPLEQLDALGAVLKARGIVYRKLDLDYAFHSRCMDPVADWLSESLAGLAPTERRDCLFVSAVTGKLHGAPLDAVYWWDNIRQPVQFQSAIERLAEAGCRTFVEIGPHAILQRYIQECLRQEGGNRVLPSLRKNDDGIDVVQRLVLRLHLLAPENPAHFWFSRPAQAVVLPNYPWQRERYWLPRSAEGYALIERRRLHPLLGWPLKDALAAWENILDPRIDTWLNDHRVGGSVVLPGAAYIEMALAASREAFGEASCELENLDILAPLVFEEEHGRTIRFDLNQRDGSFEIRSRQRLSQDEWSLHAAGRLLGAVSSATPARQALAEGDGEPLDGDTHYRLAARLGLDYGPSFRGLQRVNVAADRLVGRLHSASADDFLLHPAAVDVCFQSLLAFFREEIELGVAHPLLPVKVGSLRLFRGGQVAAFTARLTRATLRSVCADFELFDHAGQLLAVLGACRFRAATLRSTAKAEPAVWRIRRQVQPSRSESRLAVVPPVHELVRELKAWFVDHEAELRRQDFFAEALPLFDALVAAFVFEAFAKLAAEDGARFQALLDDRQGLPEECASLFGWSRRLLEGQGWLRCDDAGWRLVEDGLPPAAEIWRTLLVDYPASLPELALLGRIGRRFGDVLLGTADACKLALEARESNQSETIYDDSLTYLGSRLACEQLLAAMLRRLPPGRRLRVLEIPAAFSQIPEMLSHGKCAERLDYVIAHPDAALVDQHRVEYQHLPCVRVASLAISPPELQGEDLPTAYDCIIIRHHLHRVSDPLALLAACRGRLAAGGLLVVAERYDDPAATFLWGSSPDWWVRPDAELPPFARLLPPGSWQRVLEDIGFEAVETCHEPAGEAAAAGGYLVLGRVPATPLEIGPSLLPARWLLLGDNDPVGRELLAALQQALVSVGHAAIGQVLDVDAMRYAATVEQLLLAAQSDLGEPIDNLVVLCAYGSPADNAAVVHLLNLVQAVSSAFRTPPRLWVVTRGGVPVAGAEINPRALAHSAVWGMGRVLMNEYPQLNCTLIDFPVNTPVAGGVRRLVDELVNPDGEREIVLAAEQREVLRMLPAELAVRAQPGPAKRFRLDFRVPGQLRNLLWLEQPESILGPEEIEVRPLATGLNFRDVMYVMGLLPDEAVENGFAGASLGLEFAGVVTRVGTQVEEYVAGDEVMGFGAACFSSHVVTRAGAVAPKPEQWSFESAATVPTVFFTVYYALKHLADLQPGERVLIHGAAGGVGIAAIQLARYLGAEIFATAGSDEKRDFVALLGADHVFDSRDLAFADQILECTGGEGVDVVLNSLAGEAIRRNLRVLRPFGRFLELGKRDFFENTPLGLRPFKDNISYFGIDADQLLIARPELATRLFREVMALFRSGVLATLPYRAFPAERVVEAFRYMQQARQIGKVVVSFAGAAPEVRPLLDKRPEIRFDAQACYLVTGGLSGFGLETACWLAEHGAGKLVLLSRRGESTPSAEDAVARLSALGAQVSLLACDVADREQLAGVLANLAGDGLPLKGIFHAAMVIDDALIANLDPQRMAAVLAPKVSGAWHLHELSRHLPLEHFVLYSSITTYIGNPGQANYVAANAWLEGLAVWRRQQGLPATCVGWGPIGDVGYLTRNQAVRDSLAGRLGAEPLPVAQALQALGQLLAARDGVLAVADFHWSAMSRMLPSAGIGRFEYLRRHAEDTPVSVGGEDFKTLIDGKSPEAVRELVAQMVTHEVAQVLAVSPERLDPLRSLHDMGLDSLMGVELALSLEKRFGVQVPPMLLNEGPSISRISTRIVERLFSGEVTESLGVAEVAIGMAAQHGVELTPEVLARSLGEVAKD